MGQTTGASVGVVYGPRVPDANGLSTAQMSAASSFVGYDCGRNRGVRAARSATHAALADHAVEPADAAGGFASRVSCGRRHARRIPAMGRFRGSGRTNVLVRDRANGACWPACACQESAARDPKRSVKSLQSGHSLVFQFESNRLM
ncbi:hypothetical protein F6X40_27970 [Paraburkholderia sp. UCT31]|nr:hypothetical protein [Paraburkholderia sp. UCT31]